MMISPNSKIRATLKLFCFRFLPLIFAFSFASVAWGQTTYYSYQNGDWEEEDTWTTDPSGTLSINKAVPAPGDFVVLLNGRTVTVNDNDIDVDLVDIQDGAILNLGLTTGHNFSTLSGQGILRLASTVLPTGDKSSFVASTGGTIEYHGGSNFSFNTDNTFNNLIINLSATGIQATINSNFSVNGNLQIKRGTVIIGDGIIRTVNVEGNISVDASGRINVSNNFVEHVLYVRGDFTINGGVVFTNLLTPDYLGANLATTARVNVIFDNAFADQHLFINADATFYRLGVNKGTDDTYILNVDATDNTFFKLYGRNNQQTNSPGTPPNIANNNALGLEAGTLRLGANIIVPALASSVNYNYSSFANPRNYVIDEDATLWIDGATFYTTHYKAPSNNIKSIMSIYGKLRITSGRLIDEAAQGIGLRITGQLIVEGGELESTIIRTSAEAGTHRGAYVQTGGTVTIRRDIVTFDRFAASFHLGYSSTSFKMSGGVMNILASTGGPDGVGRQFSFVLTSAPENIDVTGGTINIYVPNDREARFTSKGPFYNLNFISISSPQQAIISAFAGSTNNEAVAALPLLVKNDLSITGETVFNANNLNVTVGHDFLIEAGSTYTPGTNTTEFNGSAGQFFNNAGAITLGLNNMTVSNSSILSISNNLSLRGNLNIGSGVIFRDMGRRVDVEGNIINSGSHISQSGGAIVLSGSGNQTIGGSGIGIFGNLWLDKASGNTTLIANSAVNGNIRLANTSAVLNIGSYNLALSSTSNVYDDLTGTGTNFSNTKMIQTSGLKSDGGVTIQFAGTTPKLYPIGVAGKYTRASLTFETAPSQWGRATIRPVDGLHPLATSGNALDYYWSVTSQGFVGIPANSIRLRLYYIPGDVNGNINNYVPGVFKPSSWSTFSVDKVSPVIQEILFDNIASVDGDFTAGEMDAFGPILTFYSRDGGGNWDTPATWSNSPSGEPAASSTPTAGNPVVIRNGHTVTVSANGRVAGSLRIENGGVLDLGTFTGHNFGAIEDEKVTGNGTIRISSAVATAQFPDGDFGDFLGENGGTVEYYRTTINFTLPVSGPYNYYNLTINAPNNRIEQPNYSILVNSDFRKIGGGAYRLIAVNPQTLQVNGNFIVEGGAFEFNNESKQTIRIFRNLTIANGASFIVLNVGGAENLLELYGNLENNGILNLNRSLTQFCDTYFLGTSNQTISGSGATTNFYRLYVNKGVDQSSILYVNSNNFALRTGLTPAPLYIQNGTIRFTNPTLTTTLSAANALNVPSTGRLVVDGAIVNIGSSANNAGDLLLSGRLEVHSGTLNIGTVGNDNHNDIEYAAAGSPEILISGGTLNVNGQIRRSTSISTGTLSYIQSGGEVNIRGRNRQVTRALLEVLNPGSVFNMSGGTINLINGGGTTFGDIYLEAEESSVTGGTINIGSGATTSTVFNLYFSNSIWNLTIDGTANAKSATLRTFPVSLGGDLTINGPFASTLNTSELPVNIGGFLINNSIAANAYQTSGNQLTRFTGSSSGGIVSSGTGSLVFQNLEIDKDLVTNLVTKSGSSGVTINRDLTITNGRLNTQTDISIIRNVSNFSRHTSSGGKLIFESSSTQQHIYGDDNVEFGGIDINNPLGVVSSISFSVSGELSFTEGFLDIGDRNLAFKSTGSTTGFSSSRYIITNGALSDAGVTKEYGVGGDDFTFPLGVAGKYTPSTFNVTSTGGVVGSVTVKPINSYHPAVQTGYGNDELQYYWNVTSTGFNNPTLTHSFTYLPTDVRGVEADYVSGRFFNYQWLDDVADNSGVVDLGNHTITHSDVNYIDGEYTAGVAANFVTKPILYSIASGDWYNGNTWSTTSGGAPYGNYPDGNPVVIENNHTVTVTVNGAYAYSMDIQLGSTLDILDTREHNFGHVKGGGTIKIAATDKGSFIFPGGFYDDFMNTAESTIEYSGSGTLPSSITIYQNITFTGEDSFKYIPSINILVRGNLLIGEGYLDNTNYNRNITILGNWTSNVLGGFMAGRGMVTFGGLSSLLTSNGGETFYNLRINRVGGELALNSPVEVIRYLYLTRGFIFTDNLNILSLSWNSANAVIGGSSSSYVDGPLMKNISTGSSFFFPVGNDGRYGRSRVFNVSTSGYWIIQYYNQVPSNRDNLTPPLQLVSTNEYWTIAGPASSSASVLLRWDTQSDIIPPTSLGRQKLRVAQYLTGNWVGAATRVTDGGVNSGTVQTTTSASTNGVQTFTLGLDETATAIITGAEGEMCDDGSSLPVTVAFTGEGPWSLTYTINGANHTTLNSIGTSPYTILFDYSELFNISGASSYLIELASVYDRFGEQGVTLTSSATLTLKVTPNPVISGNDRIMIGSQEVYSVQEVENETYSWSVSLGTIVGSSSNRSVTIDWSNSPGNAWVEVLVTNTLSNCTRTVRYDVVIRDWPVITGNFNPFASSEEIYSTPFYLGHTYLWEVVGGTIKNGIDDQHTVTILWGKEAAGSITVTQTDTESFSDSDSRLVTLTPTAQPIAFDDYAATEYITPVTVIVLTNDLNLDDIPILVTIVTPPAQGSVIVNVDNSVTYTPPAGFDGLITFVYRVADVHDDWDEATVHITVLPEGVTNHIPVAFDDIVATEYETPRVIDVLANDTGLEDVPITLSITTPPALGSALVNPENTVTFTPAAGFNGLMTFVYRVTDVHGEWDEATVHVTVLPEGVTNHIPIANDDFVATEFETAININVLANDTGLEDVPITLSITTLPALGSALINPDNTVTFTPAAGINGLMTFVYRVTDVHGEWDEAMVHVTVLPDGVANHIPIANDDFVATEYETPRVIDVLANDTGLEDVPITLSITTPPALGAALINPDNTVTFTPAAGFNGLMTFVYRVTDVHGEWDEATVHVTVLPDGVANHIPIANDDFVATEFETAVNINVLANDTGLEDVPITISITTPPALGSALVNPENTVTFTPASGFSGLMTFVYRVTDVHGEFDEAMVYVTVLPDGVANNIPIANDDYVATEFETAVNINVLANDTGLDDVPITLSIATPPALGSALVNPENTVTFTPASGFSGLMTFVYRVTDVHGEFDEAMVYVTVLPDGVANHIPIANDDYVATEFETAVNINVLANDSGLEDVPITISITTPPALGSALIEVDNTITFTPAAGFDGLVTFVYRVTDVHGEWDEAMVHVTVLPDGVANNIPIANDDFVATEYETPRVIDVLANDTGLDDVPITLSIATPPALGSALINPDNTVTFTPAAGFNGLMTFVYRVTDVHGEWDEATVHVTVLPDGVANHIPIANDDFVATEFETAVNIDVLANDIGLEDVPITLSITTPPALGAALINPDNTVTFTPAMGFDGVMTFVYRVTDVHGEWDEATVYVTVYEEGVTNLIPIANDDYVVTEFETQVNVNVLANDLNLGDLPITVTISTEPSQGSVVVEANNTITFTPAVGFDGLMTFMYRVTDLQGDFDEAMVHVTVLAEGVTNHIPVTNDDFVATEYETAINIDVLANDTGLEDVPITLTITTPPALGSALIEVDNTITFTPAVGFDGLMIFVYRVTDVHGEWDEATVHVTVLPEGVTNHIPVANDDFMSTEFETSVNIDVLANDTGLEDVPITISITTPPALGSVLIEAENTITFTPAVGFDRLITFVYRVTDVHGEWDEATVYVTVYEEGVTNHIPIANDDFAVTEFETPVNINVLANDLNLGDLPITVTISSAPEQGTAVVEANNTITFTPATGFDGLMTFVYRVTDADDEWDEATVFVTVLEEGTVNHIPVANDDYVATEYETPRVIDVLANDTGLEDVPITLSITTLPALGSVLINPDNTVTFTPADGFDGLMTFVYRVTDVHEEWDEATVFVTVLPEGVTNNIPIAVDDEAETLMNTPVEIDVLANDSGLEDGFGSITVVYGPMNGTAQVNESNTITYTPNTDYLGTDQFIYRLSDADGDSDYAVVTVYVLEEIVYQIVAIDDEVEVEKNSSRVIDVLANDLNIEGLEVVITILLNPSNGVATVNTDNTIEYVPNFNFVGPDVLNYEVCASATNCDVAEVRIQVTDIIPDRLIIPEGFSPDGDGINDNFEIIGLEYFGRVSLNVYNRWGNLVYRNNNYKNNWDGTSNTVSVGRTLPNGTYYYIIEVEGSNKRYTGNVFLKR